MTHKVFVYGSLKTGFGNNRLLENSDYLGAATIHGPYLMVSFVAFPGIIKHVWPEGTILGELWEVDDRTLASLDLLESNGQFYLREKIPVTVWGNAKGEKAEEEAWVYFLMPGAGNGATPVQPVEGVYDWH